MGLKMVRWSCLSCKETTLQCWMTQGHRYHRIFWWSSVDYPWAKLVNFAISYLQIAPEKENYNLAIGYTQEKDACKKKHQSNIIKRCLFVSSFCKNCSQKSTPSDSTKKKHLPWWPSKGLGDRPWGICAGQHPWKICAKLGHRSLTPSTFFSLSLANPRYSCGELHRLQRTGVQIIVQVQNNSLKLNQHWTPYPTSCIKPQYSSSLKKKRSPTKSYWCDVPMNRFNP